MIQRIQTLYLLAATVIMVILCLTPLATYSNGVGFFQLSSMGIVDQAGTELVSTGYLLFLMALTTILPFVAIFLFKRRMLQLRLCVVDMILALGTLIISGVYFYLGRREFVEGIEGASATLSVTIGLPVFVILLNLLAVRAIFRDEMLVKSLDRIR